MCRVPRNSGGTFSTPAKPGIHPFAQVDASARVDAYAQIDAFERLPDALGIRAAAIDGDGAGLRGVIAGEQPRAEPLVEGLRGGAHHGGLDGAHPDPVLDYVASYGHCPARLSAHENGRR